MATIRRLDVEVSAGPGAIANDDPGEADMLLDPRLLDDLRLRPASTAMLRARGDSMVPTIADGDQIVIDERDTRVS
ncbi:S24 family peptidase, partial [Staphylococcus aureus]